MFPRDEFARTITSARARAAEALTRRFHLVRHGDALPSARARAAEALTRRRMRSAQYKARNAPTPSQIALLCQTASPWRPLLPVGLPALVKGCRDFPERKLRFGAPPPPGTPTSARE